MTDMKLNVWSPAQIICMTEQFVQAQNKNNSCHVSFSSETLLTIADSKILKILRVYSKYHRHHDHHHHFYPLTWIERDFKRKKNLSNNTVQKVLTGNISPHTFEDKKLNTYVVHIRNTQFSYFPLTLSLHLRSSFSR